ISLVQTVPISFSSKYILTPSDLPHSLPLLLFSTPIIQGSYYPATNRGKESFMLSKCLYNSITNNKHVYSNIIISYSTKSKYYTAIKNNLQKTGLLVIGRPFQKKPKLISLPLFGRKTSNEKQMSVNFVDAISQICCNERHSGPTNVDPTPKNTKYITLSDANIEKDANIISTNNIKSITPISTNLSTS
ncbi:11299_t:CDS:2, partial [Dentiscutata erythropus]